MALGRSPTVHQCERIVEDEDWQQLLVIATKKIKKGDELFTTYGRCYRLKRSQTKVKIKILLPKLW